ncbi:hypothetical protein Cgig2_023994 [Carnegiea gigantea]|uniref:Peptidase A2 domain-containing protein n=1 Tax=Carnegiea gigantea TaxID=171969 RepID=A0A9Q1KC58_9CARY|nr:hypothetical protein Cgig2_023994 [Carnegiea gigantea]
MKVASAIVRRILIDTGSSMDIITWDCLKKLTYLGRDIVPLVHTILGLRGQEVNPTGMIRLPLCFGDKEKAKNVEIDFLVVDVPITYNIILGRPTLHKIKNGKLEKEEKEDYIPPTSATATSSLVTLGGSEVPKAAKSYDLAKSRTNSNLAADSESAARKLVERTRVPVTVSPMENEATCAVLKVPGTPWGPWAWPLTNRSTERVGGDDR